MSVSRVTDPAGEQAIEAYLAAYAAWHGRAFHHELTYRNGWFVCSYSTGGVVWRERRATLQRMTDTLHRRTAERVARKDARRADGSVIPE